MQKERNTGKHAHMLGKPFGDLLDYWIRVFAVENLISDIEKSKMLVWISSRYDATKNSDAYSRIYFVRKVLLAHVTRKGWINPYEDNIENNRIKESPEYTKPCLREKPVDSYDPSYGGQLPF